MPLYFFDLYNDETTHDDEGKELADLLAMRQSTLAEVRHMAAASVQAGQLNLDHRVEVRDETGKVVYALRFGDAVSILPPSKAN